MEIGLLSTLYQIKNIKRCFVTIKNYNASFILKSTWQSNNEESYSIKKIID